MNGPGILWMLQTAAGLSMAGPMFIVGVEFLRSGQYGFGIVFLLFGTIALYLPTYLINRIGGPRTWIRRRVERWQRSADDDTGGDDCDTDTDDRDASSTRFPVLGRFRDR